MTGKVKVMRSGGGFGESGTGSTHPSLAAVCVLCRWRQVRSPLVLWMPLTAAEHLDPIAAARQGWEGVAAVQHCKGSWPAPQDLLDLRQPQVATSQPTPPQMHLKEGYMAPTSSARK